jgi:hypothetical protein
MVTPTSREGKIEQIILLQKEWSPGERTGSALGRHVTNRNLSLPVDNATAEQHAAAIRILKDKYDIEAHVVRSESMGGVDVFRVENNGVFHNASWLKVARHMANPLSWKENTVTKKGSEHPALNMNVQNATPETIQYAQQLLNKWHIASNVQVSKSLGGVKVVRVEGHADVDKLRHLLPSLRNDATPRPNPTQAKSGGTAFNAS